MDQGNGRKSKLRWHCGMLRARMGACISHASNNRRAGLCGVSCKDGNGFKCHLECETHIRNEQASKNRVLKYRIDEYSRQFAKKFMFVMYARARTHSHMARARQRCRGVRGGRGGGQAQQVLSGARARP